MPRSTKRVIANDEPTACRSSVEKISHQPNARVAALPGTNGQPADTNVSTSDVNRIRSCALIHRKWISVRRLIGAGNRNAISASLNASAARFLGNSQ